MSNLYEKLKLPGTTTYTLIVPRKDVDQSVAACQLEFDFDMEEVK